MKHRELVALSEVYNEKYGVNGWYISEKLDGIRAFWMPNTCGKRIDEIPWANRQRDSRDHICTGLWSRYAKVIHAPSSFIEQLKQYNFPLDGELWAGRGQFQWTSSIVKKLIPIDLEWESIRYNVFDTFSIERFHTPGQIRNPNYEYLFPVAVIKETHPFNNLHLGFEHSYHWLKTQLPTTGNIILMNQEKLPLRSAEIDVILETRLKEVIASGGEGLMIRNPVTPWIPYRHWTLMKLKPLKEGIGTVQGWEIGRKRNKDRLGSLTILWEGKYFNLSGMTDAQRDNYQVDFPLRSKILFHYRDTTDSGMPKEARFIRKIQ